jgi:hypothetical protein
MGAKIATGEMEEPTEINDGNPVSGAPLGPLRVLTPAT